MELKTYKMGDLYTVSNGLSKGKAFFGQGYPFLTFSEVMNNFFVPETLQSLVQTEDKERTKFSIKRGDIFLNRTSETADELGISSVALKDYPNATFNGFCKRLRPITEDVVPEYIGYYLRTNAFRKHMSALTGSMITRASLRNDQLLSIEVKLPSKEFQLKIANILRQYDLLIENCKQQIVLLEEAAQRLYREWFVDMRFPGHETTPVGEDYLPMGWTREYIGVVCDIKTGKKDANFGGKVGKYPFFTCAQEPIRANSYSFDTQAIILAGNGDFNVKIFRGKFEAYQRTYVITAKLDLIWLSYFAIKNSMTKLSAGASGSTIKFLTKGMIEEISFYRPSDSLLRTFNKIVSCYFNQLETIKETLSEALSLKDLLLPRLISSQIEINA